MFFVITINSWPIRRTIVIFSAVFFAVLALSFRATAVSAFTVNSTNDTVDASPGNGVCADGAGDCTLRAAILEANATAGVTPITIDFNISGSGVKTIVPNLISNPPLDDLVRANVTIDGTTQSGSSCGDLWGGVAPVWNILIDGEDAIDLGFGLHANNITLKGIALTGINTIAIAAGTSNDGLTLQCNHIYGNATGIYIEGSDALIGGPNAGEGNVVSSNSGGIKIESTATNAVVQGNFVGTNVAGTAALSNVQSGIAVSGTGTIIGGTTAGARNLISGNNASANTAGLDINGNATVIQGNYIGTTITGNVALGNTYGFLVTTSSHTIGGTTSAERNVIAGNTQGIVMAYTGAAVASNTIQGNFIGVGADGTTAVANTAYGIVLVGSGVVNNTIGGTASGAGNTIANNTSGGITTYDISGALGAAGAGNAILGNSIYSNGSLGIDLSSLGSPTASEGVTANDTGDADTGPNNFQNYPVITAATTDGVTTTVTGTLNSVASNSFRIEFFANVTGDGSGYGEGQTYLGTATVTTDGTGNASFTATGLTATTVGYAITATASQDLGSSRYSTSEFSAVYAATVPASSSSSSSSGGGTTFPPGFFSNPILPPSTPSTPNTPGTPTVVPDPTLIPDPAFITTFRDLDLERAAIVVFVSLFHRLPILDHDWTAVNHLAYGNRIERNLEAEGLGLRLFVQRFRQLPAIGADWLIVHVLGFEATR